MFERTKYTPADIAKITADKWSTNELKILADRKELIGIVALTLAGTPGAGLVDIADTVEILKTYITEFCVKLYHLDLDKSLDNDPLHHFSRVRPSSEADYRLIQKSFKNGGMYSHVANIDVQDPMDVFHLTQHQENGWDIQPDERVRPVSSSRKRSTAPGDIVVTDRQVLVFTGSGLKPIIG